jgi:hypothetical protein
MLDASKPSVHEIQSMLATLPATHDITQLTLRNLYYCGLRAGYTLVRFERIFF